MAYIITIANAKGGCGKTTVALNLAICFSRAGYRTLAIDLDQQGNLSAGLGVDLNNVSAGLGVDLNNVSLTAHRLIINEAADIRRYLVEIRPQLHLLPNSIDIEADDLLEAKKVNRELLLRRQIKPVLPDFDIVLIDTPPAMRAATLNALVVADSLVIPIESSSFALLGMTQLLKTIAAISDTHNPSLKILVLTTMFDRRQNLDRLIRQEVERFFGSSLVMDSVIHRYVAVAEATAMRKGVAENSGTSAATFDFMRLFNELKRELSHEQKIRGSVESIHR
jgi:chromosome partitioning protein